MNGDSEDPREPAEGREPEGEPRAQTGDDRPALRRLDPDQARPAADPDARGSAGGGPGSGPGRRDAKVTVDTRRYRVAIGVFGLILVAVVSVYQFAANGVATTGIPAGHRLRWFAAPLANTNLIGDPNLRPPCTRVPSRSARAERLPDLRLASARAVAVRDRIGGL